MRRRPPTGCLRLGFPRPGRPPAVVSLREVHVTTHRALRRTLAAALALPLLMASVQGAESAQNRVVVFEIFLTH